MNADATYGVNSLQTGIAIHAIGNNGYLFYKQAASPYLYSFAGAGQVNLGSISSDVPFATSMGYTETSARASLNGILTGNFVPSSIILPTAIRTSQTGNWTGHLQKYKYYPLRVGDTQLQLLTQ
ncbi:MAG TPA: hypothetical protein DCM27_01670 [Rhodospirillaceae bacterium]|nr:hypothetical protein [Rhodospirillaceae bacterium]